MEESKGIALAVLGIVAVLAVVGLVLLFTATGTGNVARNYGSFGAFSGDRSNDVDLMDANGYSYSQSGSLYRSEGGGASIGSYPVNKYGNPVPGGNPYTSG